MAGVFRNVTVEAFGHSYRVCFHKPTGHLMIVARKTKHGEAALRLECKRAQALAAMALEGAS